jgi:hypothetical protein
LRLSGGGLNGQEQRNYDRDEEHHGKMGAFHMKAIFSAVGKGPVV